MLTFTKKEQATFNDYKETMKNYGAGSTSKEFREGSWLIDWQNDTLMIWFREPIGEDLAYFMTQQGFMKVGAAFVSRIVCGYEDVLRVAKNKYHFHLDMVAESLSDTPKVDDFFAVFKDEDFVRLYGVTEIFVADGLLHVTSNFDMHHSYYTNIAKHIQGFGIPCEA